MSSHPEIRLGRSSYLILAGIAILSVGIYLLVSRLYFRIGFPLDDAWIHQTYARNLAARGEWAFEAGHPSGGSTAPVWSALLAIGYVLRLAPYAWTYLLGTAALWGIGVLTEWVVRLLVPAYRSRFPWAGAIMVMEWHLVWSAASGMETILSALLVVMVFTLLVGGLRRPFGAGLLIGLCVWVRPDGITLLGAAVLSILMTENSWTKRIQRLANLLLGFGGLFALYLLFNLALSGFPWPTTFYAKQAEYAIYRQVPFWKRLGEEALQPEVGVGVVLLPGLVFALVSAFRRRAWGVLAGFLWFLGHIVLYTWRLPVTYQHARYIVPAMPILFILGLVGTIEFTLHGLTRVCRMVAKALGMTTWIVLLIFWGRGAYAYAQDVALIESEMVTIARWTSAHIPVDSLIAAHDIGALGYFGGHQLIDLAGLVSPEVIPFIRDEDRIASYLNEHKVNYLVTFPSWYPSLTRGLTPIYVTGGGFSPELGEDNMAVYTWQNR